MSYAARIVRIAARVAETRRPLRMRAATRLARRSADWNRAATQSTTPAAGSSIDWQAERTPEWPVPVSDEAARWLTRGEVPTDLVPLLGDPAFPDAETELEPEPAELRRPDGGLGQDRPGAGRVLARVIEGIRDAPVPPAGPENRRSPGDDRPLRSGDWTAPERPRATIEELPSVRHDGPPLLRLARSPLHQPGPHHPVVSDEDDLRAQELARQSGGELSGDGPGTSAVAFPAAASSTGPPPRGSDAGLAGETPVSPAVREQLAGIDLDELYEGFLQRLRRDLLHDRERLGDLLGPLR